MSKSIAERLQADFWQTYQDLTEKGAYQIEQSAIKQRRLKNACLSYLMKLNQAEIIKVCYEQFLESNNMTDVMAALVALSNTDCPEREIALAHFYDQWQDDPLVVDKWLAIQAKSRLPGTLEQVKRLTQHSAFNLKNPNKVYALIRTFANDNQAQFHDISGAGYAFLTDIILQLDPMNPNVASRLVKSYTLWRKYDVQRQALLKQQLETIYNAPGLSKQVYEIVSKSLR